MFLNCIDILDTVSKSYLMKNLLAWLISIVLTSVPKLLVAIQI